MNILWAAILGILQGLTEFLPVSSSGHLVLAQSLIPNFSQPGVLFDTVLHAGTLLAILFYFRKRIVNLTKNDLLLLFVGTLPVAFIGFLFSSQIESIFNYTKVVGVALLFTAILNFSSDYAKVKRRKFIPKNALIIGLFQALAIIPGISRSGATIFAGVRQGMERKKAAEFSFLLSVPAVFGANLLQFVNHAKLGSFEGLVYLAGFLTAFLSGLLAIHLAIRFLEIKRFRIFAVYAFIVGILALFPLK